MRVKLILVAALAVLGVVVPAAAASAQYCVGGGIGDGGLQVCTPP